MPIGGKGLVVITAICSGTVLASVFVGARTYTRRVVTGRTRSDDYALIATCILMVAAASVMIVGSIHGFGQHGDDLDKADIVMAKKMELTGQTLIAFAMAFSKTGVALFMMQIMVVKWQKMVLWVWIFGIVSLSVAHAIACFAQCYPIGSLWDQDIIPQSCPLSLTLMAYFICSYCAAMDFFLALCPYYILRDLNMKRGGKWAIITSLSLGVFAGVCGVIRTTGLRVISPTADYLYVTAESWIWTYWELTVTLICASIPFLILRSLLRHLRGSALRQRQVQRGNGPGEGLSNNDIGILEGLSIICISRSAHRTGSEEV